MDFVVYILLASVVINTVTIYLLQRRVDDLEARYDKLWEVCFYLSVLFIQDDKETREKLKEKLGKKK